MCLMCHLEEPAAQILDPEFQQYPNAGVAGVRVRGVRDQMGL